MKVTITPTKLAGTIVPPPSKSQAHRLLIAAALAGGEGRVTNLADSQDILATKACIAALREPCDGLPELDCGESGSTLRFFIPIALVLRKGGVFIGRGRLIERPQQPYFDIFDRIGVKYSLEKGKLTVQGELTPGVYELPGDVSSQFITGLLYALPLLEGDSEIRLTTRLESAGYVTMTLEVLERYGVVVKRVPGGWQIPGGQTYKAIDAAVEADWSQAGFWYAAAGIGNDVTVAGMNEKSCQGDRVIAHYDEMLRNKPLQGGVSVPIYAVGDKEGGEKVTRFADLPRRYSVSLDVSHCPDLVPPLAAWGALMRDEQGQLGDLYIKNAGRLRIKESDRLAAVTQVLNAMGAKVEEGEDRLTILGQKTLPGGVTVDSFNDHRIAMMAAIAATRCEKPITITGAQCVKKSYPNFWEDYEKLGGMITREEES